MNIQEKIAITEDEDRSAEPKPLTDEIPLGLYYCPECDEYYDEFYAAMDSTPECITCSGELELTDQPNDHIEELDFGFLDEVEEN